MIEMKPIANFAFGNEGETAHIWGLGDRPLPWFAPEMLPALFERELVFEQLDVAGGQPEWGGEKLRWNFTGPQGALRVELTPFRIALQQCYHDSFGLYPAEPFHAAPATKHPERLFASDGVALFAPPGRIGLRRDRHLNVTLTVDGENVLQQRCLLDLFRHQIAGSPEANARGQLLGPKVQCARLTIDTATRHQRMIGWGGITGVATYRQMTPEARQAWWRLITENNLLIQREYPTGQRLNEAADNWEDPDVVMPHYYGDNHPNGETTCFAYNEAIQRLGGQVWFEFWNMPRWVGEDLVDPDDSTRTPVDPDAYARAMVAYCHASVRATGSPPHMVGVQNEICQHPEIVARMIPALRHALDEAGFQAVRIHMGNASTVAAGVRRFIPAHQRSDEAWAMIDYAAVNMYDGVRIYHDLDAFRPTIQSFREGTADKPMLSPELSINAEELQHPGYAVAVAAAQLIHDNLTIADAAAVCWCWTLLDVEQPSYGWTRSLCVPDWSDGGRAVPSSRLMRVFCAWARYVREGMCRVEVNTGDLDLLATGFVDDQQRRTLVVINRSTMPRRIDLGEWSNLPRWERTDANHANVPAALSDGHLPLPPGAIMTGTDLVPGRLPANFDIP